MALDKDAGGAGADDLKGALASVLRFPRPSARVDCGDEGVGAELAITADDVSPRAVAEGGREHKVKQGGLPDHICVEEPEPAPLGPAHQLTGRLIAGFI